MNKEKLIQSLKQIRSLVEDSLLELSAIHKTDISEKKIQQSKYFSGEIDFDMNERAFIKKYGKGMSGPKKFVLILAYLVKGEVGKEKSIKEIRKHWSKMTSLLKNRRGEKGEFNTYYSTTAKDNNWVDSKKYGFWFLTEDWKKIFKV